MGLLHPKQPYQACTRSLRVHPFVFVRMLMEKGWVMLGTHAAKCQHVDEFAYASVAMGHRNTQKVLSVYCDKANNLMMSSCTRSEWEFMQDIGIADK